MGLGSDLTPKHGGLILTLLPSRCAGSAALYYDSGAQKTSDEAEVIYLTPLNSTYGTEMRNVMHGKTVHNQI